MIFFLVFAVLRKNNSNNNPSYQPVAVELGESPSILEEKDMMMMMKEGEGETKGEELHRKLSNGGDPEYVDDSFPDLNE